MVLGKKSDPPTAFVIHSAFAPRDSDVELVVESTQRCRGLVKDVPELRGVSTFVPVLGGRVWSETVRRRCDDLFIWRAAPLGNRFAVIKRFLGTLSRLTASCKR